MASGGMMGELIDFDPYLWRHLASQAIEQYFEGVRAEARAEGRDPEAALWEHLSSLVGEEVLRSAIEERPEPP